MKKKSIIITGGAGFIGSNLARSLAKDNAVCVIDDLSTGKIDNIQDLIDQNMISFVQGSVTDSGFLQKNFKDVDYVFHEAAIPSVPRSVVDPVLSNHVSVSGTLNVLLAARDNNVKKVVFASSSSVYGDTPSLPKKEDMVLSPLSPYAVGKLAAEYYCQVFTHVYNLPTVSLRYFNVYGPCQDPKSEYAAVIPKFITHVLKDTSPVIYGDGSQTRDFTFVRDIVQANVRAAESNCTGVFNTAGGCSITIQETAELIISLLQKKVKILYDKARVGDILHSYADSSKAKKMFGYSAQYDFKTGLKETIAWYQKKR